MHKRVGKESLSENSFICSDVCVYVGTRGQERRVRCKNKRTMRECWRNENKSTCGYEDGFEELGEKHLRQIERGRSHGNKTKIACGPKWLLQISMTPSPPRPNLRWLIDYNMPAPMSQVPGA